jgi:restriction endonuclease Mrr
VTLSLDDDERREVRWKARTAVLDALTALGGEGRRQAINAHALATAGFTRRELEAPPPERGAQKYAGLVDHDLSWALTNLKRDGLVENPKWSVWCLTGAAATPAATVADNVSDERLCELRAMEYYGEYLRTPEWRKTRAAALVRAGHRCQLDANHTTHLEVHHNSYDRVGAELALDLIVLCHSCHRLHHRVNGRPIRAASKSSHPLRGAVEPAVDSVQRTSVPPPTATPTPTYTARKRPPAGRRRSWLRRLLIG